jgi:competence ComEA-like helix-hairpin-helix protein
MNTPNRTIHRLAGRFAAGGTFAALLLLSALAALPAPADAATGKVNVNTADAAQLALLPRVGPSLAQKILDFRKQNGPFKATEDLMLVRGMGEKTYQLVRPYVAVSGETTLREKVKASAAAAGGGGGGKEAKAGKDAPRSREESR